MQVHKWYTDLQCHYVKFDRDTRSDVFKQALHIKLSYGRHNSVYSNLFIV